MASLQTGGPTNTHARAPQHHQQHHPSAMMGSTPVLDPETSPIPGQQAWAILDLHGRLVRSSSNGTGNGSNSNTASNNGSNSSDRLVRDAPTLYAMLAEATPLVPPTGLRRMTVNLATVRYVVARDEHHVYLVQTKGV